MNNIKYPVIAFALVFLAYCKSKKTPQNTSTPPVVAKPAFVPSSKQLQVANLRWPNTTADEISQGENIYTTKCTECHAVFDIMEFGEKKWLHEIDDMSPKAKLTPEEKLKLSKHILSYREANAPVKAK